MSFSEGSGLTSPMIEGSLNPTLPQGSAQMMRIMTFNIRFENDRDGPDGWDQRRDRVTGLIQRYDPLILGTQEGKWNQLSYLHIHLPAYVLHTPNRIIDDDSQCPTLFIRPDRYEILGGSEWWLSKTPEVHLSKDWDSAFPRMMSTARLRDRSTGHEFRVAVTHLDHLGIEARSRQASIVAEWVQGLTEPVIVMGDFNDNPDSPVHHILTSRNTGLRDTWEMMGRHEGPESFTHHGFQGIPQIARMDWILVSRHFRVRNAFIIRDNENGRYPSDHFPCVTDLEWA